MLVNFLIKILSIIFRIFFPYEIKGRENFCNLKNGFLICSNHISNLDAIFISIALKQKIYFLAKSELFKNRFISYLLTKLGAISIRRGEKDTDAIKKAENVINNNKILGIFIEGTRSKNGDFLRPKSGAAILACKTNSLIIPVCITPLNNKKTKVFQKTIINFGKPIKSINFNYSSYKEIRSATEFIMNRIKELRN
ncbi:MAG: 1-acyl-sn-glycerol-3-phosphate acyltransferase [Clostridia bacterium]|nr:1-acyl-sn-glycerol-3-phosphate acyltransferase [Clostridia bacterium]